MADIAFRPDAKLAALEERARTETNPSILATLREQIATRTQEIMREGNMPAVGVGGQGYYAPQLNVYSAGDVQNRAQYERQEQLKKELTGKIQLLPQGDSGVYRAVKFNADGTTTDISQGENNKLTFFDANGNPLSAAQVAQTKTGQGYANAGWNIGFGAGVLPEGTAIIPKTGGSGNRLGMGSDTGTGSSTGLTANDVATQARRTAQQEFRAALTDMGLADLADTVDEMIRQDFTTAQIRLELPKTKAYELRFPGMKALRDAKQAISEATYISMEKGYLQTLGAYGLDASVFGSRAELGKYIANLVSPREFEERVDLAATRVKENPDLITQFKVYYPEVDNSALTAYLLDPSKGMDIIKKQIRTAEIGAASVKAGFSTSTVSAAAAEALIGATGTSTYAALSQSFARAKELATQQSRLAGIEGTAYQEQEAIGAVVGGDITKTLASQARAEREVSRFAVRGGLTATSLQNTGLNI